MGAVAPPGLAARIALEMIGALLGDAGVVVPQMGLSLHLFHRRALAVPDRRNVKECVGFPAHLLGLMRFEQIKLWRTKNRLARIMAPALRDHAALHHHLRGVHMIGIVRVILAVRQHERRLNRADQVHQPVLVCPRHLQRVIAQIKTFQLVHAQYLRGGLGLGAADGLDLCQRLAFFPQTRAFATLSEGQTGNSDLDTLLCVQGNRTATAPDEIRRMCGNDKRSALRSGHAVIPLLWYVAPSHEHAAIYKCKACDAVSVFAIMSVGLTREPDLVTSRNLRHFRVFLAVAELGSASLAAHKCRVSQPAVTQALAKLEEQAGGALFERNRHGFTLSERGQLLEPRLRRAVARLDAALAETGPRLPVTATTAQLQALVAVSEAQNSTLAAHRLGLAQPTVHRAISQIEQAAGRTLFTRSAMGILANRACHRLAQAARLSFAEFDQIEAELAEYDGREVGRIVIGALPLSRSALLPEALARFRAQRPTQLVTVLDGPYSEMLAGLRRGDLDVIIGALRAPLPIEDVIQEPLFSDRLGIVARPGHPLAAQSPVRPDAFTRFGWIVQRPGTPARAQFDRLVAEGVLPAPSNLMEIGSILLIRELLIRSDLLGCISSRQAEAEVRRGLLVPIETDIAWPPRTIGLTYRVDWVPTAAQSLLLDLLRQVAETLVTAAPSDAGTEPAP